MEEDFAEKLRQLSVEHDAQLELLASEEEAKLMHMRESLEAALEQERRGELERNSLFEQLERARIELKDLRSLRLEEDREGREGSGVSLNVNYTSGGAEALSDNSLLVSADLSSNSSELKELQLQLNGLAETLRLKEDLVNDLNRRLEETTISLTEAQNMLEEIPELRAELEDLYCSIRIQAEESSRKESVQSSEIKALQEKAAVGMEEVVALRKQLTDHQYEHGSKTKNVPIGHESESDSLIVSDLESSLNEPRSAEAQVQDLKLTIKTLRLELEAAQDREMRVAEKMAEQQEEYSISSEDLLQRLTRMEQESGKEMDRVTSIVRKLEEELQTAQLALRDKEERIRELVERHDADHQLAQSRILVLKTDNGRMERMIEEACKREHDTLARLQELEDQLTEKDRLLDRRLQILQSLEKDLDNANSKSSQSNFEELSLTRQQLSVMQADTDELRSQLAEARANTDAALRCRQEATDEVVKLNTRIAQMEDVLGELRKAIKDRNSVIADKDSEISALNRAVVTLESSYREANEVVANRDRTIRELRSRLQSEKTASDKDMEDRIITIASLEEELRLSKESLLSLEDSLATFRQSVMDLSSQLLLKDNTISELNESLRVEKAAKCDELSRLNALVEEAVRSKKTSDDLVIEMKERNDFLNDELVAVQRKSAALEELTVSLKVRVDEAETAVAIFESKKKRDLEFLRKQNETIALLQRQIEESKVAADERENSTRIAFRDVEDKLQNANSTILALQESLATCQSEMNNLVMQQQASKHSELEPDDANARAIAVSFDEERCKMLETKINEMIVDKEKNEELLTQRTADMSHIIKCLQGKVDDLEEERERLEEEVRMYTNQVAEACREQVKKLIS